MNENTEQLIRELADKFGTTTEHLWGVMVNQAHVEGMFGLVGLLVATATSLFVLIGAFRLIRKKYKEYNEGSSGAPSIPESLVIIGIAATGAFLILVSLAWDFLYISIVCLLNPEYWALKEILKSL